MNKQTKQVELAQLIKDFLFDGTYKGLGDLSMMVSHIISAYDAGLAQAQQEAILDGGAKKVSEIYNKFHQIIDDQPEMYEWFRKEMTGENEALQKEQE